MRVSTGIRATAANMKKTLFIFGFIISLISCGEEEPYIFVTQYNLSSTVAFDFTKNYSAKIGTVTFLNKENKKKKWRYIYHAPRACLYNKKTKECDESAGMSLVSHNPDPETADSVFWTLLGSATSHTPVKPYGSTKVTLFINLKFYPRPRELIQNIKKKSSISGVSYFYPLRCCDIPGSISPPGFHYSIYQSHILARAALTQN